MKISLMLNGTKIEREIAPDLLLIDFATASNGAVKLPAAACVQYFWMKNRSCPVPCLRQERTGMQ